jgi:VWFA-related protein
VASGPHSNAPLFIGVAAGVVVLIVVLVLLLGQGNSAPGKDAVTEPKIAQPADATQDADAARDADAAQDENEAAPEIKPVEKIEMLISQINNNAFPAVTLFARIMNADGEDVVGVSADDFSVYELDGAGKQYVAEIKEFAKLAESDNLSINMVIDQSGSMGDEGKMEQAIEAAQIFLDEISGNRNNFVELTSFDDEIYHIQPFTSDIDALKRAVQYIYPGGETALYDALYSAIGRANRQDSSRCVVAFTDGLENASVYSYDEVIDLAKRAGIPIYMIGIGYDIDETVLSDLAAATGGTYLNASIDDLSAVLSEIYLAIYNEQRNMYQITYESTYKEDEESFRSVRLFTASGSAFEGEAEREYVPVDNVGVETDDIVIEDSDVRRVTEADLEDLTELELTLARNEIFARHGRLFTVPELQSYFDAIPWYAEIPDKYKEVELSQLELDNALFIIDYAKAKFGRNSYYAKR